MNLETHVRGLASLIWDREAGPQRIGGVNIDCVIKISDDNYILIEITEECSLNKVREDVIKLSTARGTLFHTESAYAKCFCVVGSDGITASMRDAGSEQKIKVTSVAGFDKSFFDFSSYEIARKRSQFGSAVNPITGEKDDSQYTPVTYTEAGRDVTVNDICSYLINGKKVIMTGEYGSGKSRCMREIFYELSNRSKETGIYPIAIDLRENWGLRRASEIIRRHFDDLGVSKLSNNVMKGINNDMFVFMLDGFDELGFQSWSDDSDKLKNMRNQSLEGVRDLISRLNGGVFISGREHYFNNDDEMLKSLGLHSANKKPIIITSKSEFSESEMAEYMADIAEDYDIPSWIPRRPLICQTIVSLDAQEIERMFGQDGGDVEFWHKFMHLLCRRDAKISTALDAETVFGVLGQLARITRAKGANVGPITLGEIQKAFETVIGEPPDEQASVMLQRLPGLGRVKSESNDRQFIDIFILDGLRAADVSEMLASGDTGIELAPWRNPLEQLGQRILADLINKKGAEKVFLQMANRSASLKNRVLASDIVASIVRCRDGERDFGGLALDDGHFIEFDMTASTPTNLRISNSTFSRIVLCPTVPRGTFLTSCVAGDVYGVTSSKGLPSWAGIVADRYQTADNVSRIRRLGLLPSQEILVAIIRKTFFQKGAGRKEEALLRGLGKIASSGTVTKIINILLKEDIIERFKGDEGFVYKPKRSHTERMQRIINELNTSSDSIWADVSSL